MHRRDYLSMATAATTVASVTLAGCTTAVASIPPPDVPAERLEAGGWTERDRRQWTAFEETYTGVTVEGKAHTITYEDTALRRAIHLKTMGQIDTAVSVFAATRLDLSSGVESLPVAETVILEEVGAATRTSFEDRLRDAGLTAVERTGTGDLSVETGETDRLTNYRASLPRQTLRFPVAADETIEVEIDQVRIDGDLAVWRRDASILVATAAYPAENVVTAVDKALTSAVSVDVTIDLGLTPEAYRAEVRELMTAVE